MDWILIDFEEIFNKRRPYPNHKSVGESYRIQLVSLRISHTFGFQVMAILHYYSPTGTLYGGCLV
jgi:hypothetical protein